MIIGIPKEIKNHEYRVAVLPQMVEYFRHCGHIVLVQRHAGHMSGYTDEMYIKAGARIVTTPRQLYGMADCVIKVKEPQLPEIKMMRDGMLLVCFLHLASSRALTEALMKKHITALGYETYESETGGLPFLKPMSEIAGRLAVQEVAKYMESPMKGRGILLSGVPGVEAAQLLILGAGVVGSQACKLAAGLGASVVIMDTNLEKLRHLDEIMPSNVQTLYCDKGNLMDKLPQADGVISSVLIPGAKAPRLIDRQALKIMKPGAVVVDVAIDQGGSLETSKPTTHDQPVYLKEKILHYCVSNMPSAVPKTSTPALFHALSELFTSLASENFVEKLKSHDHYKKMIQIEHGALRLPVVSELFNIPCDPL